MAPYCQKRPGPQCSKPSMVWLCRSQQPHLESPLPRSGLVADSFIKRRLRIRSAALQAPCMTDVGTRPSPPSAQSQGPGAPAGGFQAGLTDSQRPGNGGRLCGKESRNFPHPQPEAPGVPGLGLDCQSPQTLSAGAWGTTRASVRARGRHLEPGLRRLLCGQSGQRPLHTDPTLLPSALPCTSRLITLQCLISAAFLAPLSVAPRRQGVVSGSLHCAGHMACRARQAQLA